MIDEPLIVPLTPGELLARLHQVSGVLSRSSAGSAHAAAIANAAETVTAALANNAPEALRAAQASAQEALLALYHENQENAEQLQTLGFPSPEQLANPTFLAAPDPSTVITTSVLNGKQVLTSIAFDRAPGATGYWLHVVRYWQENGETQRIEDPILESSAPLFTRVKLPIGKHILRLKSRNLSVWAITDEFEIEVPQL